MERLAPTYACTIAGLVEKHVIGFSKKGRPVHLLTVFIEISDQIVESVGHDLSVLASVLNVLFIVGKLLLVLPVAVVGFSGLLVQSGVLLRDFLEKARFLKNKVTMELSHKRNLFRRVIDSDGHFLFQN